MTKLWYDEEKSNRQIESYMTGGRGAGSGVSKNNVIVIYSDLSVDSSGGDGSLNPNSQFHLHGLVLDSCQREPGRSVESR